MRYPEFRRLQLFVGLGVITGLPVMRPHGLPQICRTPKKTKRQAGGLSYFFGSSFRFTTGCLRESNELSVRRLAGAPSNSALSS